MLVVSGVGVWRVWVIVFVIAFSSVGGGRGASRAGEGLRRCRGNVGRVVLRASVRVRLPLQLEDVHVGDDRCSP